MLVFMTDKKTIMKSKETVNNIVCDMHSKDISDIDSMDLLYIDRSFGPQARLFIMALLGFENAIKQSFCRR